MKRYTRFLSALLACCMMMGLLPTTALATESEDSETISFAGGDGTAQSPYQIATAEQLDAVRNDMSAHYVLCKNINLNQFSPWVPIGTKENPFTGSIDGNNYEISGLNINNTSLMEWVTLHQDAPNYAAVGLFGEARSDAQIANIRLADCLISINGIEGLNQCYTGAVCGFMDEATIESCVATGNIVAVGCNYVGGIVGYINNAGIKFSMSSVDITSTDGYCSGGIAGYGNISTIMNCSNQGDISCDPGLVDTFVYAGGIMGIAPSSDIINSENHGNITGTLNHNIGASGSTAVPNAGVGGIIGAYGGTVSGCKNFGDIEAFSVGTANSAGGICGCPFFSVYGQIKNCYNYATSITCTYMPWDGVHIGEERYSDNAARICPEVSLTNKGLLENNYSISSTLVNDQLCTVNIGENRINGANIEPASEEGTTVSSIQFLSRWDAPTRVLTFNNQSLAYTVSDLVDTSSIEQFVGKYVLVETAETNIFEVTSIKPVDSKIGVVRDVIIGNGNPTVTSLQFEDGTYSVVGGLITDEGLIGETVLYHLYSEEIYGFEVLEEKTGTLEAWDSATGQATIDGTVYPTNFLTDRSFLRSLEEYLGKNVTYFVCGDEAYKPLIRIDGIVETEKGIMVFSTEKSLTVQTGEFMWLAFGRSTDGGMLEGGWQQMAVVVSDPTVISLMEYEETEYGYQLEVYGKKQGATNVTITDTESGASTSIVITVRDAYTETYSYAIDNMQTFYPNNNWEDHVQTNIYDLNGLYVNNYQCRKTGDTYTVSFDAYNQRYHTGAVDIYDADGNWLKSEEIAKMEMISSLWDTGEQLFYLISNSMDGKILTYEAAAVSEQTQVSFEVPDGGYFTISNNYAESPGTFLFNSCDILFDGVCDLIDAGVDGTEKSSFMKLIMGEFEDNKTLRESFMETFKSTAEGQARAFSKQILKLELADASSNITQQLEDLFESLGLNWKNLFKIAADVGEGTILDKMGPAGLALKGCFEFAKGGSKLTQVFNIAGSVDAPYANVYSSIEEGYVNKHGVIVNTNGNMDTEAVLQVFKISNDHTIEVILDGSGGDRPKDYVLYNICFVKNDQLVQPSGNVSVRIPIPEWMDDDTCTVYRQEEDGNWTPLIAHIEGNYLVFETDHFSLYGVVGELSELSISSLPNQTQYIVGDILNPDGLVLSLNGDLIDTGFICEPMVLSEPGTQKITVRYGIASTEFTIFVQADPSGDDGGGPVLGVYTITFDANLGNWGDNVTSKEVKTGSDSRLTAVPENPTRNGYNFDGWFSAATGGEEFSNLSAYVFTEDTTLYAQWVRRSSISSGGSSSSGYTVTVEDTDNGTIRVSPSRASRGDTVTITVDPDAGYELGALIVCDSNGNRIDVERQSDTRYTFEMPSGRVTVEATFVEISEEPDALPFVDIPTGAYYYNAVRWAVDNDITNGTSATSFGPDESCTRAQVITFLWRAAGCPAPVSTDMVFTDVSTDSYYYDAVLWAIGNNITKGTDTFTFSPDETVTRGQIVTFLWRAAGCPEPTTITVPFIDVPVSAYYFDAVLWAVENNITTGISATAFAPERTCIRAETVTFLYRAC